MKTLDAYRKIIDEKLAKNHLSGSPKELYEPIKYILDAGGKRIRPSLCLLACDMFSADINPAIYPAISLEVFHNFTLLHDDIMDKATMRRNQPTVHKKWNENVAILSGDAMMILAYKYLELSPADKLPALLKLFNETALEVCEGQQYDMNFEKNNEVSIGEYLKMIELKTAVLIATCLKFGAILGSASVEDTELIYCFGLNIGIAFQLQDDYLDTFGDPEVFGKTNGGDIVSNKKTFLLLKALELAEPADLKVLNSWLQTDQFDSVEKIQAVTTCYRKIGVDEILVSKIKTYYTECLDILSKINVKESSKHALYAFVEGLAQRNS